MATLRRRHAPVPWGAQVENIVWEKSRAGKPRRRRLDRPLLTHDPEWDWDGSRALFSKHSIVPNSDKKECTCESEDQLWVDEYCPVPWGKTHTTMSLLDIARYEVTQRCSKARSGLGDFEVIRVPNVVPVSEEGPDPGDRWRLDDWEKLDALSFKRTYSEVAQGFADEKDPSNLSGCSRLALSCTEDDSWERL